MCAHRRTAGSLSNDRQRTNTTGTAISDRTAIADLNDATAAVCRAIVGCPARRVQGATVGYRNKVTYTLTPTDALGVSSIAMDAANTIAREVHVFARGSSSWPLADDQPFGERTWLEITVKLTRTQQAMVKLTLRCSGRDVPVSVRASMVTPPLRRPLRGVLVTGRRFKLLLRPRAGFMGTR
jgi:hypothetical protein